MSTNNAAIKWISAILLLLIVIVVVGYLWLRKHPAPPPQQTTVAAATTAPASTTPPPPAQQPVSKDTVTPAHAATAPLPALADSDAMVRGELAKLGLGNLHGLLVGKSLIQRVVATVNALPGDRLPSSVLPVRQPAGVFTAAHDHGNLVMSRANARRYARYAQLLEQVDTKQLVDWYVNSYPLFEQAWRQLGYPKTHFNDRLMHVLDLLLATPVPAQPPKLQGGGGIYQFVDPKLENLAIGQKILLRLGPKQEAAAKAKLRAIRAALTGRHPQAATAASAG